MHCEYINLVVPPLYVMILIPITMKLQKQKAREYKGKPIYKWVIVIPPEDIEKLDWKPQDNLKGTVINNKGYFLSLKE